MELNVGNRHGATGEKCRPACLKADRDQDTTYQLNHAPKPQLRADGGLVLRQNTENLLNAMKRENCSGADSQYGIRVVIVL